MLWKLAATFGGIGLFLVGVVYWGTVQVATSQGAPDPYTANVGGQWALIIAIGCFGLAAVLGILSVAHHLDKAEEPVPAVPKAEVADEDPPAPTPVKRKPPEIVYAPVESRTPSREVSMAWVSQIDKLKSSKVKQQPMVMSGVRLEPSEFGYVAFWDGNNYILGRLERDGEGWTVFHQEAYIGRTEKLKDAVNMLRAAELGNA